eukprot:28576-Pelagococcus_subviridis.AAC.4
MSSAVVAACFDAKYGHARCFVPSVTRSSMSIGSAPGLATVSASLIAPCENPHPPPPLFPIPPPASSPAPAPRPLASSSALHSSPKLLPRLARLRAV